MKVHLMSIHEGLPGTCDDCGAQSAERTYIGIKARPLVVGKEIGMSVCPTCAGRIAEALTPELARLRARVAELEGAIEPLGNVRPEPPDAAEMLAYYGGLYVETGVVLGDLRRAAKVARGV